MVLRLDVLHRLRAQGGVSQLHILGTVEATARASERNAEAAALCLVVQTSCHQERIGCMLNFEPTLVLEARFTYTSAASPADNAQLTSHQGLVELTL